MDKGLTLITPGTLVEMNTLMVEMTREIQVLKRENAILREELKDHIVNNLIEAYDINEAEATEEAEKQITWMIAHNEGAE